MLISCGFIKSICRVSLFTREWIEISGCVSLEWVPVQSPSLRGSGLKWLPPLQITLTGWESPSLRGSGLKLDKITTTEEELRLPLYEGVD